MAQKFLYLVDFWVPFPASEYSGLLAVVGKDDNEVHDILLNWRDEYLDKYDSWLCKKLLMQGLMLLAEDVDSVVVESFTTWWLAHLWIVLSLISSNNIKNVLHFYNKRSQNNSTKYWDFREQIKYMSKDKFYDCWTSIFFLSFSSKQILLWSNWI